MFRLLEINYSKLFLSPEQDDPEVLIREPGLAQDLFLRLFFKIESPQNPAVALAELSQAVSNRFAKLQQIGFGQTLAGWLWDQFRHRLLPQCAAPEL